MEELLEVLQLDDPPDPQHLSDSSSEEDVMLLANASSTTSPVKRRTMRLQGMIGKRTVLILIDSGANCSFVDAALATELQLPTKPMPAASFVIAGGDVLTSSTMVPQLTWWTQGHTFCQDMKVLSLGCYDLIVGADWLESHSPMWVHWQRKWMRFTHEGRRITLKGIRPTLSKCKQVSVRKMRGLLRRGAIQQAVQIQPVHQEQDLLAVHTTEQEDPIPPEVQSLLLEFEDRFRAPSSLPPHRPDDHTIPLIPGAQPVSARPYRYTPQQKDEIERQIKEMLRNGIIRPSSSPFAAPVLLVRKKDGTWRFCVDYRQLNAITIKNKHPMPVVDELLDEISGAKWFTKLDLLSGYHQIRVADEDVFKTAFRTHQGLYEFLVMPFGLSRAPGTFQGVIHKVLDPLLRHGILAFMDDILVHTATLEEHLCRLREVLQLLRENELVIKRSKCAFAQPWIEYLGHVISAAGVATDPAKVEAVQTWPTPTSVRAVRGFLGLIGYY